MHLRLPQQVVQELRERVTFGLSADIEQNAVLEDGLRQIADILLGDMGTSTS